MRVNVYAEEMTDRVEIISKTIDGQKFTGCRFYLELPVTIGGSQGRHRSEGQPVFPPINGEPAQVAGPFIHRPGDDDSAAITFWGKRDLRTVLLRALAALDDHYGDPVAMTVEAEMQARREAEERAADRIAAEGVPRRYPERKCRAHNRVGEPCDAEVFARVYWPGRTLDMCALHAERSQALAGTMGFVLSVEPLAMEKTR